MLAGALLTYALYGAGQVHFLPGLWLLLFGASVYSGGALSVRIIPVMGSPFWPSAPWPSSPAGLHDVFMGAGFGALLIAFGLVIARYEADRTLGQERRACEGEGTPVTRPGRSAGDRPRRTPRPAPPPASLVGRSDALGCWGPSRPSTA